MKDMGIVFPMIPFGLLVKWFGHNSLSKWGSFWRFSQNDYFVLALKKGYFEKVFFKMLSLKDFELELVLTEIGIDTWN